MEELKNCYHTVSFIRALNCLISGTPLKAEFVVKVFFRHHHLISNDSDMMRFFFSKVNKKTDVLKMKKAVFFKPPLELCRFCKFGKDFFL